MEVNSAKRCLSKMVMFELWPERWAMFHGGERGYNKVLKGK